MFTPHDDAARVPMLPGVSRATLVHGDQTLLAEFQLTRGHSVPRHAHPQEQTGYLVSGRLALTIGDETFDVHPGDGWCVAAGLEHGAEIIEDSVAVEAFSPVREDYLPTA